MRKECRIKTFDGLGPFSYVCRMIRLEPNTTETCKIETCESDLEACGPQFETVERSLTEEFIEDRYFVCAIDEVGNEHFRGFPVEIDLEGPPNDDDEDSGYVPRVWRAPVDAGWKSPASASDLTTGMPTSPSLWSSTAKIGTWCCTRFAYHLLSFGRQILHRRWLSAKYGFWPCSQMNVFPLLTCRPIDKAIGQLDSKCMWSSPRFSQYMRIASLAICCPPPVEKLIGNWVV